jgi:hypothetical protein
LVVCTTRWRRGGIDGTRVSSTMGWQYYLLACRSVSSRFFDGDPARWVQRFIRTGQVETEVVNAATTAVEPEYVMNAYCSLNAELQIKQQ